MELCKGLRGGGAVVAGAVLIAACPALGDEYWTTTQGETTIAFDVQRLAELGIAHAAADDVSTVAGEPEPLVTLEVDPESTLTFTVASDGSVKFVEGELGHTSGFDLVTADRAHLLDRLAIRPTGDETAPLAGDSAYDATGGLRFGQMGTVFDPDHEILMIRGVGISVSRGLADALGNPRLAGEVIGSFEIRAEAAWTGGDIPLKFRDRLTGAEDRGTCVPHDGNNDGGGGLTACCSASGPDVIIGLLPDVCNFAAVGDVEAFSIGTLSCNIGDTPLLWQQTTTNHPVMPQNMYRLKDGRFEQIGMSWLKHGFLALAHNDCGCGCIDPNNGALLGIGCSDPYSCGLNGQQSNLGPHYEVNAHTGAFNYPFAFQGQTGNSIYKRLQVHIADLDPAQNGGGTYFAESQYVSPDDAAAGNQDNNLSYRQIGISGAGTAWTASFAGQPLTVREQPAVRAWQDNDPSVVETDARVPNEGLMVLAAKTTNLGGNTWHYEYALQNLNSHRGARSFSVPFPAGTNITNVGFHDVDYHSGDGEGGVTRDGTDWVATINTDNITWETDTFAVNPNANALLFCTTYNFRFDANVAPDMTAVTIGLFRGAGDPSFTVMTAAPPQGPGDCQPNGIPDDQDIAAGTSQDCNGNSLPDECEVPPIGPGPDCNADGIPDDCQLVGNDCNTNGIPDDCEADCQPNGIPDECDITGGASPDCDANGVPDECQVDCDGDGVPDVCEVGIILFQDDFETDMGWTVVNDPALADGAWERADPREFTLSGAITQPEDDHTPGAGTLCYVTKAGGTFTFQSDVDGGPTRVMSPSLDLSAGTATLSYSYWLFSDATVPHTPDSLEVEVSGDDGANWTPLITHTVSASAWRDQAVLIDDAITPTTTTRIRFSVADVPSDSFTEALIDDVQITIPDCPAVVADGDCDVDGDVDFADFAKLEICYGPQAEPGCECVDFDADTDVDATDYETWFNLVTGPL